MHSRSAMVFLFFCSMAGGAASQVVPHAPQLRGKKLFTEAQFRNGLGTVTTPWHAAVEFELFDEGGNHEEGGTFEEWWLSPRSYRSVFQSDHLKQTDVATNAGLFREGDQRWMTNRENNVLEYLLAPIKSAPWVDEFVDERRNAPPRDLACVSGMNTQQEKVGVPIPLDPRMESFCFLPGEPALRYSIFQGGQVALFDESLHFSDHFVAGKVQVNRMNKPWLRLTVTTLEPLGRDVAQPVPTAQSAGPLKGPIELPPNRMHRTPDEPEFFFFLDAGVRLSSEGSATVKLQLSISPEGRVLDVAVLSGPRPLATDAARAIRKARYVPFEILGTPVEVSEVETEIFASGPLMRREVPPPGKSGAFGPLEPVEPPKVPSVLVVPRY